jgi:hypothetical protein
MSSRAREGSCEFFPARETQVKGSRFSSFGHTNFHNDLGWSLCPLPQRRTVHAGILLFEILEQVGHCCPQLQLLNQLVECGPVGVPARQPLLSISVRLLLLVAATTKGAASFQSFANAVGSNTHMQAAVIAVSIAADSPAFVHSVGSWLRDKRPKDVPVRTPASAAATIATSKKLATAHRGSYCASIKGRSNVSALQAGLTAGAPLAVKLG